MFGKERVVLDLLSSVNAQPLSRVSVQQLGQQRPGIRTDFFGEPQWVLQDLAVHFVGVLIVEGRKSGQLQAVSLVGNRTQDES